MNNVYNINPNIKFSNRFSAYPTLYYRKTTDEMEFFVEKSTINVNNQPETIFTSTIANIGDYYAYGLELGASYKPINWWNMYAEVNLNGF